MCLFGHWDEARAAPSGSLLFIFLRLFVLRKPLNTNDTYKHDTRDSIVRVALQAILCTVLAMPLHHCQCDYESVPISCEPRIKWSTCKSVIPHLEG